MKSLLVNSCFNSGKQVAAIIVAFVASPIIVHTLGDERYGVWSLIISITGYFSFLEFGVATAVVKYVSHFSAQNDRERTKSVYTTASLFFAAVGAVAFLATILAGYFFDSWFDISLEGNRGPFFVVLMLGTSMALSMLFSAVTASLFALQEIPVLSTVDIVTNVLKNTLLVILLLQGYGLLMMAVVTLLAISLRLTVLRLILARRHPFLGVDAATYSRDMLKTVLTFSLYSFIIAIASKLMFFSNSVIIGKMVGIREVTFYSIPASLLIYVEEVVWSLQQVLIPVISGYDATGNVAGNRRLYTLGTRYSMTISLPVMVTLFAVGDVFIANWMGEQYAAKGALVLRILVVGYIFGFSQLLAEVILKGTNRHRVLAFIMVGQALIGIAISISLAPNYGIEGVALGAAIPLVLGNLFLVPVYTCRVLGMNPIRFFRHGLAVPALLVLIFAVAHRQIAPEVSTYFDIVLYATGVTVYFGIASWFFVLEKGHRGRLVNYLRRLLPGLGSTR